MEHRYNRLDNPIPRSDHVAVSFQSSFLHLHMCIQDNEQCCVFLWYEPVYVYLFLRIFDSALGMWDL